jgi:hypothetical protein
MAGAKLPAWARPNPAPPFIVSGFRFDAVHRDLCQSVALVSIDQLILDPVSALHFSGPQFCVLLGEFFFLLSLPLFFRPLWL